jgi:hypothetical protein
MLGLIKRASLKAAFNSRKSPLLAAVSKASLRSATAASDRSTTSRCVFKSTPPRSASSLSFAAIAGGSATTVSFHS